MGWYYNPSGRPVAVELGDGEVLSVRPGSVVKIAGRGETLGTLAHLVSMGKLQRTGDPGRKKTVANNSAQPVKSVAKLAPEKDKSEGLGFNDSIVAESKLPPAPATTTRKTRRRTKASETTED